MQRRACNRAVGSINWHTRHRKATLVRHVHGRLKLSLQFLTWLASGMQHLCAFLPGGYASHRGRRAGPACTSLHSTCRAGH